MSRRLGHRWTWPPSGHFSQCPDAAANVRRARPTSRGARPTSQTAFACRGQRLLAHSQLSSTRHPRRRDILHKCPDVGATGDVGTLSKNVPTPPPPADTGDVGTITRCPDVAAAADVGTNTVDVVHFLDIFVGPTSGHCTNVPTWVPQPKRCRRSKVPCRWAGRRSPLQQAWRTVW